MKEQFPNLIEILSWADERGLAELMLDLKLSHLRFCANEVAVILDGSRIKQNLDQVRRRLMLLPESGVFNIMNAPETLRSIVAWRENGDDSALVRFFQSSIEAEVARHSKRGRAAGSRCLETIWTALGDACFGRSRADDYTAPCAAGGLVLDARSPQALRPMSRPSASGVLLPIPVPMTHREEQIAVQNLRRAVTRLKKHNNRAFDFVRQACSSIVLQKTSCASPYFTSVSARPTVGRITLVNPHLKEIQGWRLEGAIIHEAVHSTLYRIERLAPIIPIQEHGISTTIISPWSENRLRLNTYIHACYIYFALINHWHLQKSLREDISSSLSLMKKPFLTRQYLKRINEHRSKLDPLVMIQLKSMHERIKEVAN
jgi:hypothetical protein